MGETGGKVGSLLCPDCGIAVKDHVIVRGESESKAFKVEGCFLSPSEVQLVRHRIIDRVRSGQ